MHKSCFPPTFGADTYLKQHKVSINEINNTVKINQNIFFHCTLILRHITPLDLKSKLRIPEKNLKNK